MIDLGSNFLTHNRLGIKSHTKPGLAQHGQVIRTIANSQCGLCGQMMGGCQLFQQMQFCIWAQNGLPGCPCQTVFCIKK